MRNLLRLAIATATIGAAVGIASAPASADQHGTNYCVSGVFDVHQNASADSPVIDQVPSSGVWHHYDHDGNWSFGYVRGAGHQDHGYIPLGALTRDLGNDSTATTCPALAPGATSSAPTAPQAGAAQQKALRLTDARTICAQSVTVRNPADNQPIGELHQGDRFDLDRYSPSGGYAVGTGYQSGAGGHSLSGMVISNTITDASGHCQPPYN